MTKRTLVAAAVAALFVTTPAFAMNKGELVDAIASSSGISKADAKKALDEFISSTSGSLKKGDRIALVGFGAFSVSVGPVTDPGDPTVLFGGKPLRPIKVRNRNGNKSAGTVSLGTDGTWELVVGLADDGFYDDTIELEIKMPKPIDPRLIEISLDLPSSSPGSNVRQILDQGVASGSGVVLELTLPSNTFADFTFDPARPDPDFHAALYGSVHAGLAADPCVDAVVADRLGFDGHPVCALGTVCSLDSATRNQLIASMASSSGLTTVATTAVLDSIEALSYPPPLVDPASISGFGSLSVSNRSARTGRNPQTGKTIKIKAKKVVKFKAGADLASTVN